VTLLPMMKGLPDSVYQERIKVSATPLQGETGELSLDLQNLEPELQKDLLVLINGIPP
jgi:hypothetical protein